MEKVEEKYPDLTAEEIDHLERLLLRDGSWTPSLVKDTCDAARAWVESKDLSASVPECDHLWQRIPEPASICPRCNAVRVEFMVSIPSSDTERAGSRLLKAAKEAAAMADVTYLLDGQDKLRAEIEALKDLLHSADDECERLEDEVERCHARLEINLEWRSEEGGGLKCVEIPMEKRASAIDGIEARDCTIKLQDEKIELWKQRALTADEIAAGFRAEVAQLSAEVALLRMALERIANDDACEHQDDARAALGDQPVDINKVMK